MQWEKYPENKPSQKSSICWVCNPKKSGMNVFQALYSSLYDSFELIDSNSRDHPPIDVAYFIEQPPVAMNE